MVWLIRWHPRKVTLINNSSCLGKAAEMWFAAFLPSAKLERSYL